MLDFTHDADTPSWVATANAPDIDFPLQNLPFGRFRPTEFALRGGALDTGYAACWAPLKDRFAG